MNAFRILPLLLWSIFSSAQQGTEAIGNNPSMVTRATLRNGLRVVLVKDTLAPVVTIQLNVLVGGSQDPIGFPGLAHAQEHMAFRGCEDMTSDQTSAIYAQLGDTNNAETQQEITQYYATVPSADLDLALEAQAKCFQRIDNSQEEWEEERRSLSAEVDENIYDPAYEIFRRIKSQIFSGTSYALEALGTKQSLNRITSGELRAFHEKWYTPSNEVLVVVGDIDPATTLNTIGRLFGHLQDHPIARPAEISLRSFASTHFSLYSDGPNPTEYIAYRLPGTESPDYAAATVLAEVLDGSGSRLDRMVTSGAVVSAGFGMEAKYRKASLGLATVEVAHSRSLASATLRLRQMIYLYATQGVPENLVRAARNRKLSEELYQANSIPGLADVWSNAVAAEGRLSPQEDFDALRKVTQSDVNRVARKYLLHVSTVSATMKPAAVEKTKLLHDVSFPEKIASAPIAPIEIPAWAADKLETLVAPKSAARPADMILSNGIRLLVRTDTTTPTITLLGSVRHNDGLQTPPGKEGVAELLGLLYDYGAEKTSRVALDRALGEIYAEQRAGYHFFLRVPREYFSRGTQLLAQNELTPHLSVSTFRRAQKAAIQQFNTDLGSSDFRFDRALIAAMVPASDPTLRRATPGTLSRITLDDVRRYYSATVRPDLTTIVVVGDISPETARAEIERWFGEWKAKGPPPHVTLPPVPSNKAAMVRVANYTVMEDSVVLAQQLPLDRFSPDYYPLQLGTQVLDGGFYASRLYRDLRRKTGYVYSVDASLAASATRAIYSISYSCDPKNIWKVRDIIEQNIERMRSERVSEEELHQAKSILLREITLQTASQTDVATGILEDVESGLTIDEPVKAANHYLETDAETVRQAFARSIAPNRFVQVVLGSLPSLDHPSKHDYARRRMRSMARLQ